MMRNMKHKKEEKKLYREIFTNGSILLLLGSFLIGLITGESGFQKVEHVNPTLVCPNCAWEQDSHIYDSPATHINDHHSVSMILT